MRRSKTQRELRNDSGEIMRALDRGEHFVVTRNGAPVGELSPVAAGPFVDRDTVVRAFANAPIVDQGRFRADLDDGVDQEFEPRA
jgi:antitoxin (DNA-binding transcriptional repressor) of toxin-antitoxin stability system